MRTQQNQTGYTLVELMVVVAVIGILSAVAIPVYSDYRVKSRIGAALIAAASLRTAVGLCIHEAAGVATQCHTTAPGATTVVPAFTATPEVASASVASGTITLTLANGLADGVDGKTITITPTLKGGAIHWTNTTTVTNVVAKAAIEQNNP